MSGNFDKLNNLYLSTTERGIVSTLTGNYVPLKGIRTGTNISIQNPSLDGESMNLNIQSKPWCGLNDLRNGNRNIGFGRTGAHATPSLFIKKDGKMTGICGPAGCGIDCEHCSVTNYE